MTQNEQVHKAMSDFGDLIIRSVIFTSVFMVLIFMAAFAVMVGATGLTVFALGLSGILSLLYGIMYGVKASRMLK